MPGKRSLHGCRVLPGAGFLQGDGFRAGGLFFPALAFMPGGIAIDAAALAGIRGADIAADGAAAGWPLRAILAPGERLAGQAGNQLFVDTVGPGDADRSQIYGFGAARHGHAAAGGDPAHCGKEGG